MGTRFEGSITGPFDVFTELFFAFETMRPFQEDYAPIFIGIYRRVFEREGPNERVLLYTYPTRTVLDQWSTEDRGHTEEIWRKIDRHGMLRKYSSGDFCLDPITKRLKFGIEAEDGATCRV